MNALSEEHTRLENVASATMTESYQQLLASGDFQPDEAQANTVARLQQLTDDLIAASMQPPTTQGISKMLLGWLGKEEPHIWMPSVRGLYLWGGVGTGKTFLMNLFFKHLPFDEKLRVNFHHFMQVAHENMKQYSGEQDPMIKVADTFMQYRVICLDEIHVTHISDAMIFVTLARELLTRGITIIFTSNREPDVLYKHGLQRERFLPAIKLIEEYCEVFPLDGGKDYRKQTIMQQDLYLDTADEQSWDVLEQHFKRLSGINLHEGRPEVIIHGRTIDVIKWADSIVWFDFHAICDTARSTEDYAEIARMFPTVIVSDIPLIDNDNVDAGRRFINMIYVFYEHSVNMIVSAAAAPEDLYVGGYRLRHPFVRTASRLIEMRSEEYIAKHVMDVDISQLNEERL